MRSVTRAHPRYETAASKAANFKLRHYQVFRNLNVTLRSIGCTRANLVKLTVFLRDTGHLAMYREARDRFFALEPISLGK